jgi:Sec-independent protein translocase protein TatA
MRMGIGLSEVLLILALIVIFTDSKKLPGLIRKSFRTAGQLRTMVRRYWDDISR